MDIDLAYFIASKCLLEDEDNKLCGIDIDETMPRVI